MKIAILGGGITGLVCAETLSKSGFNEVTIYESEAFCGGLASGFVHDHWGWSLERAYHHIFSSDKDILNYAKSIGFDKFFFESPKTSSLYLVKGKHKLLPIDTPIDLILFPLINIFDRIRAGIAVLLLKLSPHLAIYEKTGVEELMKKMMGDRAYKVLFGGLMQKKFGKYAGNILSAFIWARINKRTKKLGYVQGGFQAFVDYVKNECEKRGVKIRVGSPVSKVEQRGDVFAIFDKEGKEELFDYVVSTLPSPVAAKSLKNILNREEIENLENLKHLASMNLILETKEKYFESEYWVSNCVNEIPTLVFVQHTNFVDSQYYDGKNILYIGNYLTEDDPLWSMDKNDLLALYKGQLEKITGKKIEVTNSFLFRAKLSQPIFDEKFVSRVPKIKTSNPRLYFANLDMTYPYDRGTNYAVRLGKKAAQELISHLEKHIDLRL